MIPIKSPVEIEKMREAGTVAAEVLNRMCEFASVGVSTYELDCFGRDDPRPTNFSANKSWQNVRQKVGFFEKLTFWLTISRKMLAAMHTLTSQIKTA